MINWLLKLIPADYKWSIAAKNIAYDCGKGLAMLLTYGKIGNLIGSHLSPEQINQAQVASTAIVGAVLAWLHDYLQVKFPNSKLL